LMLACAVSAFWPFGAAHQRVLMRDVTAITLHKGEMTASRRVSAIPQLRCIGGGACNSNDQPDVVQCTRTGFDGRDAQWKCEADLEKTVRFGQVEVVCEGFDHPKDEFILKDSCGLEYELKYTKAAQSAPQQTYSQPDAYNTYLKRSTSGAAYQSHADYEWSFGSLLTWGIVIFMAYFVFKACIGSPVFWAIPE